MAPSALLPVVESQPFPPPLMKLPLKTANADGTASLNAQAHTPSQPPFSSQSPPVNGNGHVGNGAVDGIAPATRPSDNVVTSLTLLEQTKNLLSHKMAGTKKQPNILYIMADQMAAPLLKMNDPESLIKTPNLDELARTGVVFSNAYCNSPLCAPSRFTMCSGKLPSKIGGYDNASIISTDVPTYAHYLRREGYETVLAGKMHFIGQDQLHGFERRYVVSVVKFYTSLTCQQTHFRHIPR